MSTDIRTRQVAPVTPENIVEFDTTDPNLGGTIFTPDIQGATNTLYVSQDPSTTGQTWVWNTTSNIYETYTVDVPENTPFNLYGTSIDAGGNKTAFIQRNGPILVNSLSTSRYAAYLYSRKTSGDGNGVLIRKDLRTTSGNYLLVQGWNSGTGETQDKFKVDHDGKATINDAYTLPNVDGTAGQVPITDGSGNITWEDGGGGGKIGISNSSGVYTYYDTLTLAMAGAVSGDTIEMFADVEETGDVTVTHKNGVNINGNGHTYTLSIDSSAHCLYNNNENFYAEIYNIKILRTGRVSGGGNCLNYTKPTSKLKCFAVSCVNTYGVAVVGRAEYHNVHGVGASSGFYDGNGAKLYNCYFESSVSGHGLFNASGFTYNCIGKSINSSGIFCNGEVYQSMGVSTSSTGISAQRMTNCVGVSTSGYGLLGSGRGCTGISTSGIGGTGTFYNSTLISSSNYAVTGTIYSSSAYSSSSITCNSGRLYNSNIICLWNNSAGHCTTSFGLASLQIIGCYLEVTNPSAYCITGYVGSTWNYANNSFKGATTPINTTNITQGITNTSDSQGNILI